MAKCQRTRHREHLQYSVAKRTLCNCTLPLPSLISDGVYTLSFRLDEVAGSTSTVIVNNVTLGTIGIVQPATLNCAFDSNSLPVILLNGPAGLNYIIQESTNLVDWAMAGVISNRTGSISYSDQRMKNEERKFYRVLVR